MLINTIMNLKIFIYIAVLPAIVIGQTTQWRLLWDKNPPSDSIAYYVVFRQVGIAPAQNDSIGMQQEPSDPNQQTVNFTDSDLQTGTQYFYRVQAVDYLDKHSPLSISIDESIPKILMNRDLKLQVNSTTQYDLNSTQFVSFPGRSSSTLSWTVSSGSLISININPTTNVATIITPVDSNVVETFEFTVISPTGFSDKKSITISLTSGQPPPPPPDSEMVISVNVANLGSSIVRISWKTRQETRDYLEFGLNNSFTERTRKETEYGADHEIVISQLLPQTEYQYRIISEDLSGIEYTSSTFAFTVIDMENINVFPIPYNANEPPEYGGVYFDIPSTSVSYKLLIYTVFGDLVFSISDLKQSYVWKVVNSSGRDVNAGLYLYYIKDQNENQIDSGKLVIIR